MISTRCHTSASLAWVTKGGVASAKSGQLNSLRRVRVPRSWYRLFFGKDLQGARRLLNVSRQNA